MKRIAIVGGGISGLTAAYELELARLAGADIDWQLYDAGSRFGGIIETTQRDGYVLEGGPDGWVSEKPWARDLAIELGLESDLIASNDSTRKTYILLDNKLQPIPDRMRLMVPEDLSALENSPLFSAEARRAYAEELSSADQLRHNAPDADESVASFIRRHFDHEVLRKLAAPLLSGVFGGDVETLSVRAVMPQFVAMEREHGSLIAALQAKAAARDGKPQQPIFTSLRNGLGSLIDALVAKLPPERLHLHSDVREVSRAPESGWMLRIALDSVRGCTSRYVLYDRLILATPLDVTRRLLQPLDYAASTLLPKEASSAILTAFVWPAETARSFTIPQGFGLLVPPTNTEGAGAFRPLKSSQDKDAALAPGSSAPQLLAATFVHQKFPHRAPEGATILRTFFGAGSAEHFAKSSDAEIAAASLAQLREILGPLPGPAAEFTTVRRWPRSLPQYAVGHLDRIAELSARIDNIGFLTLLGNSYRGVGLPDLIRYARDAARSILNQIATAPIR
jgi:oxygen-dependent protoporphyrinogen oxidase